MKSRLSLLSIAALLLIVSIQSAVAQNWSTPVAVTSGQGDDHHVSVNYLNNSAKVLITWDRLEGDNTDVYARFLTLENGNLGPEIRITDSDSVDEKPIVLGTFLEENGIIYQCRESGRWAINYAQYSDSIFLAPRRIYYSEDDLYDVRITYGGELGWPYLLCRTDSTAYFRDIDMGVPPDSAVFLPDTGQFLVGPPDGYVGFYYGSWIHYKRWAWDTFSGGRWEIQVSFSGFPSPYYGYSGLLPNSGYSYHHPSVESMSIYFERGDGNETHIVSSQFDYNNGSWSNPERIFQVFEQEKNPHLGYNILVAEVLQGGNWDIAFWHLYLNEPELIGSSPGVDANPCMYGSDYHLYVFWESDRDGTWKIYYSQRDFVGVKGPQPPMLPGKSAISVYPNPGNSRFTISLDLPILTAVKVNVYDITGKLTAQVQNGSLPAGRYGFNWDAASLPSGIYLVQAHIGEVCHTQKLVLLK